MTNGYRDLIVWQKSMDVAIAVYRYTEDFPKEEVYGLVSQMRRAAVSIPSNIAEGSKRHTDKDFKNFLSIAYGSAGELETQLELAERLTFGTVEKRTQASTLLQEVAKMLHSMTRRT